MTDAAPNFDHVDFDEMFAALCSEVGFCLHEKGQKKVVEALPKGLDAAVKAVLAADGVDEPNAPGDLKKAVRDCLKAHIQPG
ncbi:hypothetical protein U0030_01510 [Brevundimonas bullata]|jgi:hypothetical protein|uniref:hypothetical protein n=1 Tax=Brevundimonas bullata TaxID=13160 RepID=UPI000E0B0071|nr:hypothetical protein [Brevundimonas bullata]WQE37177.1 hypothetical protein U0030_01510 [Brevundimonas bullata]